MAAIGCPSAASLGRGPVAWLSGHLDKNLGSQKLAPESGQSGQYFYCPGLEAALLASGCFKSTATCLFEAASHTERGRRLTKF